MTLFGGFFAQAERGSELADGLVFEIAQEDRGAVGFGNALHGIVEMGRNVLPDFFRRRFVVRWVGHAFLPEFAAFFSTEPSMETNRAVR